MPRIDATLSALFWNADGTEYSWDSWEKMWNMSME